MYVYFMKCFVHVINTFVHVVIQSTCSMCTVRASVYWNHQFHLTIRHFFHQVMPSSRLQSMPSKKFQNIWVREFFIPTQSTLR